jgi:hypothetical protein
VTSHTVAAAAALESDPEIRKAIELQGFEENRHARLLVALTSHYGIPVTTPQVYVPKSLESDFMSAGFGECSIHSSRSDCSRSAKNPDISPPNLLPSLNP